ncbi:hypothetical protein [Mycobacteroides abscessus]|nr:hypothetical protein [Mycobacteroides abscessus]
MAAKFVHACDQVAVVGHWLATIWASSTMHFGVESEAGIEAASTA